MSVTHVLAAVNKKYKKVFKKVSNTEEALTHTWKQQVVLITNLKEKYFRD